MAKLAKRRCKYEENPNIYLNLDSWKFWNSYPVWVSTTKVSRVTYKAKIKTRLPNWAMITYKHVKLMKKQPNTSYWTAVLLKINVNFTSLYYIPNPPIPSNHVPTIKQNTSHPNYIRPIQVNLFNLFNIDTKTRLLLAFKKS